MGKNNIGKRKSFFYYLCLTTILLFSVFIGMQARAATFTYNFSNLRVDNYKGCNAQNVYTYTTFYFNVWDENRGNEMKYVYVELKKDGRIVGSNHVTANNYMNYCNIPFYVTESGSYTAIVTCRDINGGSFTAEKGLYVYPVSRCGAVVEASSSNISLSMTGNKSQTVSLKVKSDVQSGRVRPDTVHYNFYQSNTDVVSAKWGEWYTSADGYSTTDLILTGKKGGNAYVTVTLREGNTDTDVDKVTINISVGPEYTVSYNANGGSGAPSGQTKTYGNILTLSSTKPYRTGYDFLGWSTSSTAASASYFPGGDFADNSSVTLYAVWKLKEYTVHYDANGGSGKPSDQTKYYGKNLLLSSVKPIRTGYDFMGWSTSSIADEASYQAGGSYIGNSSITLYAVWKLKEYTVHYDANGGSGQPSDQIKYYGKALSLSTVKPVRTGYDFMGWSTSSTVSEAIYQAGESYSENNNVTLYAVWKPKEYTVHYDANGGKEQPSDQIKYYGRTLMLSTIKPVRTDYDFMGWSTSSTVSEPSYQAGGSYTDNSDITLYAVWKKRIVSISDCQVDLSEDSYIYDGTEKKPSVTVKYAGIVLRETVDYTVAYRNNKDAGTAEVILTGMGIYTDETKQTFIIHPKSLENAVVKVSNPVYAEDGITVTMSVTAALEGLDLILDQDYSMEYQSNASGIRHVSIIGKGNYTGKVSKELSVTEIGKYHPSDNSVLISAQLDKKIAISVKEEQSNESDEDIEEIDENVRGMLQIRSNEFQIDRDYNQSCMIEVYNDSARTQRFYLSANNRYKDLSMEIIKSGSESSPLIIEPGESLKVELSVFAQNAEQDNYSIPVTAYIFMDGQYRPGLKENIKLTSSLPVMKLSWKKLSEDSSTLRQKYRIVNNGDDLTDLKVLASETLEDYVMFAPIVSNYELKKGESVEFTVQPDLTKMKEQGLSALEGELTATCAGLSDTFKCVFDTKGEEITTTTMGELALKQEGNPFTKFEAVEDSVKIQYLKDGEYVELSADDTIQDILDENKLVDYEIGTDIDLGVGENISVKIGMKSDIFKGSKEDEESLKKQEIIEKDGGVQMIVRTVMSSHDYEKMIDESLKQPDRVVTLNTLNEESLFVRLASENPIDRYEDPIEDGERKLLEYSLFIKDTSGGVLEEAAFNRKWADWNRLPKSWKEEFKEPKRVAEIDIWSGFNIACDVCSWVEETSDVISISNDSRVSSEDKQMYQFCYGARTVLHLASIFTTVSPVLGVPGLILSGVTYLADKWFEGYQAGIVNKYRNMAAMYSDVAGQQCTNRGLIETSFYVPDYSKEKDNKLKMTTTSRMKPGDGWVDDQKTNYDITLNGESAGRVTDNGVTDVTIADIPTDNLKPGENNTLVFDYDTSPGHHFVSTDTRITILYPADTEISYIGNPEEIQNVRLMPDFEVNPENIFTEGELVAGEKSVFKCNVYNLGSHGGWYNIMILDGEKEIYRDVNRYLDAFTKETIQMDWTPSTDSSQITVSIANTTVGLEELRDVNNTAVKTFRVRQREIPEFGILHANGIYEGAAYSMTLDMEHSADLKKMKFYIDDTEIDGSVYSSGYEDDIRYYISSEKGLSAGKHILKAVAEYNTTDGIEQKTQEFVIEVQEKITEVPDIDVISQDTLTYGEAFRFEIWDAVNLIKATIIIDNKEEVLLDPWEEEEDYYAYEVDTGSWKPGNHSLILKAYYKDKNKENVIEDSVEINLLSEEDSYFFFALDQDIVSPEYYICSNDQYEVVVKVEKIGDSTYRFKKPLYMYENISDYTLLVKHDKGTVRVPLEENHVRIQTKDCNSVNIVYGNKLQISNVVLKKAEGVELYAELEPLNKVMLTPGKYVLQFRGSVNGRYFSKDIETDVTYGNSEINLDDYILDYAFKINNSDSEIFSSYICYKSLQSTYWMGMSLDTTFDQAKKVVTCTTVNENIICGVEDWQEAYIYLYTKNEIYKIPLIVEKENVLEKNADGYVELDKKSLHEVSLKCNDSSYEVKSAIISERNVYMGLTGDVLYLPSGEYKFIFDLDNGRQSAQHTLTEVIEEDTGLVADSGLEEVLANIKVGWADSYDDVARVQAVTSSNAIFGAEQFENGSILRVSKGRFSLNAYLVQNGINFSIYKNIVLEEQEAKLDISNRFAGIINGIYRDSYDSEDGLSFYVSNMTDENGNRLQQISTSSEIGMYGNITFVNLTSGRIYIVPFESDEYLRGQTDLPAEEGLYHISVEIFTKAQIDETVVKKGDISRASISLPETEYIYDGTEKRPEVTVILDGNVLEKGRDYTVAYMNNIQQGIATVEITGKGNYTGQATTTFNITKAVQENTEEGKKQQETEEKTTEDKSTEQDETINNGTNESDGKENKPLNGESGKAEQPTTQQPIENNPGTEEPSTTQPSSEDKSGTEEAATTQPSSEDKSGTEESPTTQQMVENNSGIEESPTMQQSVENNSGTEKPLTTEQPVMNKPGTTEQTVTQQPTIQQSTLQQQTSVTPIKKPAKVKGLKAKNKRGKKLNVSWSGQVDVSGFEIQCAQNKKFTKGRKTKTVKADISTKTISKLKKGKTYYVRVRSYKKTKTGKLYGKWSKVKKIKIKK